MQRIASIPCAAFLLLLSALVCAPPAAAQHRKPEKKVSRETIENLEEQWRQAQLTSDTAAMDRLLADDYVGISVFGLVTTKAQQISRIRERQTVLTRLDLSDIKVKLVGPIAIVTSLAEIQGTNEGKPISGMFRYTRVYQHLSSGAWKITSFEATRVPAPDSPRNRPRAASDPAPADPAKP